MKKKVILWLLIVAIIGMFVVIGVVLTSIGTRQKTTIPPTQEEQAIKESDINQFSQLNFAPLGPPFVFFDKESANLYYFTWGGVSEDYYLTWWPVNFECGDFETPLIGVEFQSLDGSNDVTLSLEFDSSNLERVGGKPTDVNYDWNTIHKNKKEPLFINNNYIFRCDNPSRLHILKIKINSSANACGEYKFKMILKGSNAKKKERELTVGVGCDFFINPTNLPEDVKPYIHGFYSERSHFTFTGYENDSFINPADSRINEVIERYILDKPISTTESLIQKVFNFVKDRIIPPTGIFFHADVPDIAMAEDILKNGFFYGGTCGHHSYLSISLLRNLGIPARKIYFIFTNKISDHSAVEIWIPGKGWTIYDSAMNNLFDETFYQEYLGYNDNVLYAFAGVEPFSIDSELEGLCDREDIAKQELFTVDRSSIYSSKDIGLGISGYPSMKLKWTNMNPSTKISEFRFYAKDKEGNTLELQPINTEDTLGCDFGIKRISLEQTKEAEGWYRGFAIRKSHYVVEYKGKQYITPIITS